MTSAYLSLLICHVYVSFLWISSDTSRFLRPCFNSSYDLNSVGIDWGEEYSAILLDDNSLKLRFRFSLSLNNPNEVPVDGILIRFTELFTSGESPYPINVCVSGNSSLWVHQPDCPQSVAPICPEIKNGSNVENITTRSTLCSVSNCSFLGTCSCYGTYRNIKDFGYYSVPIEVITLEFVGKFFRNYQLNYMPYYRQYTVNAQVLSVTARDCHEIVRRSNNVTLSEAIAICCDADILHFKPLELKISEIQPNFTANSAVILVTWMPPVFQNFTSFAVNIYPTRSTAITGKKVKEVKMIPTTNTPIHLQAPCYNSTFSYQVEIEVPDLNAAYDVYISPVFSERVKNRFCQNYYDCRSHISLDFLDIDLCTSEYDPCDASNVCLRQYNSNTTSNYTCLDRCAQLDVSAVSPLNFEIDDVTFNITDQKASLTFQWLPPITQRNNPTFELTMTSNGFKPIPVVVQKFKSQNIPLNLQVPCYNSTYSYKTTVHDLFVNQSYKFIIKSIYPTYFDQKHCREAQDCSSVVNVDLAEIDFCEDRFKLCNESSKCNRLTGAVRYSCGSASSIIKNIWTSIFFFQVSVYALLTL